MKNFLASISGNYDDLFLRLHCDIQHKPKEKPTREGERERQVNLHIQRSNFMDFDINLSNAIVEFEFFRSLQHHLVPQQQRYQVHNLIIVQHTYIANVQRELKHLMFRDAMRAWIGNVICVYALWLWLQMAIFPKCVLFFGFAFQFCQRHSKCNQWSKPYFCVIEIAFVTLTAMSAHTHGEVGLSLNF